jgi:hypothetical protein
MNNDNVAAVRNAYAVAERKDLEGWIKLFTPDGVFVDNSVGSTYRGRTSPTRSATTGRRFPTCIASYIASMSTAMSLWCNWSLWRAACHG